MANCLPCHATGIGFTMGKLDMSSQANAFMNLVGKTATMGAAMCGGNGVRVVPMMSAKSVLYSKVSSTTCGNRMPSSGMAGVMGTPLSPANIATIKTWIDTGAGM
jgi:hypothetical protein